MKGRELLDKKNKSIGCAPAIITLLIIFGYSKTTTAPEYPKPEFGEMASVMGWDTAILALIGMGIGFIVLASLFGASLGDFGGLFKAISWHTKKDDFGDPPGTLGCSWGGVIVALVICVYLIEILRAIFQSGSL